jgi:steroid 5-alpha reductase family enzyme
MTILFISALSLFIFINLVFVFAALKKRNDYADIAWGLGFIVAALAGLYYSVIVNGRALDLRTLIALILVSIWGLRLSIHIAIRTFAHSNEDPRYKKWREEWGKTWLWRSYLQVFLLQGVLSLIVNSAVLFMICSEANGEAKDVDAFVITGITVWVCGFVFESIADRQLTNFKKEKRNKGQLLTTGLWAWSRHPNYFGEVVQWWGIFLLAVSLPWGWLTAVSPIAITFFILKISGVPMLEEQMKNRAGAEAYRIRTSIFFPLPPRRS